MPRAYISARLEDELAIKKHRNILWNVTNADRYYKKVDPHITVIPPFTVKQGHEDDVKRVANNLNIKGKQVSITGFDLYEGLSEPFVVLLSVDVDLESERQDLMEKLPPHIKGSMVEPVTPHITLFKTQGWWEEIDDETSERLNRELNNRYPPRDTKITRVETDFN